MGKQRIVIARFPDVNPAYKISDRAKPKHVYKPKGAKPGMAIYKHETVIWVKPNAATRKSKVVEEEVKSQKITRN